MYDLRLPRNDFWKLTLGQFHALYERLAISNYRAKVEIACLYVLVNNLWNNATKLTVEDVIGINPALNENEPDKADPERIKNNLLLIFPQEKMVSKMPRSKRRFK